VIYLIRQRSAGAPLRERVRASEPEGVHTQGLARVRVPAKEPELAWVRVPAQEPELAWVWVPEPAQGLERAQERRRFLREVSQGGF